jgi:2-oxoisovalerate dehydrogenase E2 component (dihydrolipoyl transacylase)
VKESLNVRSSNGEKSRGQWSCNGSLTGKEHPLRLVRFVQEGSSVEEFDVLVEVQSDKASVEITSRYAGVVKQHCYKEGEVAKVGSALCKIEMQAEEGAVEEPATQSKGGKEEEVTKTKAEIQPDRLTMQASSGTSQSVPQNASTSASGPSLATPAVRRIVREHRVDINQVKGTGKSGRVTKEDVQAYLTSDSSSISSASSSIQSSAQGVSSSSVKPLTGTRKAMFKAMSKTWAIPHFGYSDEIDITKLDQIRKEMQAVLSADQSKEAVVKLTMLPFLLKALSLALYRHAIFRSTLDEETMSLHEKDNHSISIALSSSRGLLTPTLPCDVRQASIIDVAEQIQTFQRIITERGLTQSEMGSGATVTLSNIGNIGGLYTFPLIPPTGQLIIGAVGRSRIMPRFNEQGDVVKAFILPVSFSADHRVVEGVELARFVQDWKLLLENPSSWLLTMR